MAKSKAQQKKDDARISRIYGQVASGVQVGIMDLPKIFNVGMAALDAGGSDEVIGEKIAAAVAVYRKN